LIADNGLAAQMSRFPLSQMRSIVLLRTASSKMKGSRIVSALFMSSSAQPAKAAKPRNDLQIGRYGRARTNL
jgi:hypothetical protein